MIGYDLGMTTKIAVSLPDDLVVAVKEAVARGEAASVSAYVAAALRKRVGGKPLLELLAEWSEELGPPSPEDYAWARNALGLTEE
jgi:Arc/MetJ-type ribon-helix-helix transcriptional regulator